MSTNKQLKDWFNSIREPMPYSKLKQQEPQGYRYNNTYTSEVVYIPDNTYQQEVQVAEITEQLKQVNVNDTSEDKPLLYTGPVKNINEDQK